MAYYFGFTPTPQLKSTITSCMDKIITKDPTPIYPLRDEASLGITAELIDAALGNLILQLPDNDKKEKLIKLVGFIKSTVNTLLKQLLGNHSNEVIYKSLPYFNSIILNPTTDLKVAISLPDSLGAGLIQSFNTIINEDHKKPRAELVSQLTQLSNESVQIFLGNFTATLELGLIKRKASEIASSGIAKALAMAINSLIPALSETEIKMFAAYYLQLVFIQA